MKKSFLLILLSGMIFISSCEKKVRTTTTIVSGTVINAGSKQPIDSVKVTLLDGVSTAGEIISGNTTSGNKNVAYTDKEGKFRVEITGEYEAYIAFSKEKYEAPNGGLIKYFSKGIHDNEIFEMKAEAFFWPTISTTKLTSYTSFCPLYYDDNNCWSGWSESWSGTQTRKIYNVDLGGFRCIGDKYMRFKIEFLLNNEWNTKIDSVYIKSFETYRDTIYY